MKLLQVDSRQAAIKKLLSCASPLFLRRETIPLSKACGRILSQDLFSREDIPGFHRSSVDGYAVQASDTAGAGESLPAFLQPVGKVEMGKPAELSISAGQCAYVPTGGMLPEGADAMVMIEYCENFGGQIAVSAAVSPGRHVVYKGEDLPEGRKFLSAGSRLGPAEIGLLAATGCGQVEVYRQPSLCIFSSGDELVPPESELQPGQVRDINSFAVAALAEKRGFCPQLGGILPDQEEDIRSALRRALEKYDILAISGGSSQGEKDMTERILDEIASPGVFTHGLAVKPGKPTILGWDEASSTLLVGLPGHPVSAMMVFESILAEAFRLALGLRDQQSIPAHLRCNIASSPGKTSFQPVKLLQEGDALLAEPVFYKSGLITTLTEADGYCCIPQDQEGLPAGALVEVRLF
ncbi:MAG: molybdopterin molybdotransferase MoeA [Bacillota bacterium]|nr:molybdopterin molybdotransferase MoeA [Bacillota bacterium]